MSMRAVVIGATLACARHTMADPGADVDKLIGKAFMPAIASPKGASQILAHAGAPGVVTDGAPLRGENFKLEEFANMRAEMIKLGEIDHDIRTELQGVRSQTHVQTMPIDAHWRSIIYGFGYGMGVVFLASIIYKFFYKSRESSAISPANGEVRTSAPVMQVGQLAPGDFDVRTPIASRTGAGGEPFVHVQGQSLRTWSYPGADPEQVQVVLNTEGRPLDAAVELWHGPDNTPTVMRVYVEDGFITPFSAVIATPRSPNTVAVRNIGQVEFPLSASVFANNIDVPTPECLDTAVTVQGGAVRTFAFHPGVDTVQVLLTTDGRPLNARIELLQGPTNEKQIIELYNDDGMERPFFGIINSPGSGSVVRIVNTGPIEFPMSASVVPY